LRSSAESSDLIQSRTVSPPPSVRKKIAGTRFPGFSGALTVYHGRYNNSLCWEGLENSTLTRVERLLEADASAELRVIRQAA
jgi:hypothetical protein